MSDRDCDHGQLARSCEICDLESRLAAAEADAERYRWLRESQVCEVGTGKGKEATIVFWRDEPFEPETAEQLDALIDAARGGE